MSNSINGGGGRRLEGTLIVAGMVTVQALVAVYTVFIAGLLAVGVEPLFLVAASGFVNSLFLFPLAAIFEKKKWPSKLGVNLMVRFALIALGGIPIGQVLQLIGVKKTTPAVATAMPNLAPGLVFIIASCIRLEKFNIRCDYSRSKILGTLICLCGAITLSFSQSPQAVQSTKKISMPLVRESLLTTTFVSDSSPMNTNRNDWMIGCLYLLVAVLVLSCTTVLMASTMVDFPAPISINALTTVMGSTFAGLFQLITQGSVRIGSSNISISGAILAISGAGLITCIAVSGVAWCMQTKGPVFVSVFQPMQTICAAILSAVFLRQPISLASFAGIGLMFAGLYIVLWAKNKEAINNLAIRKETIRPDNEKPLLC